MEAQPDSAAASHVSIGALLADATRRLGHAPLLTYYDDTTGERTELSYATFDNWVSKTANFFVEEFDAAPATRMALGAAESWLGAVAVVAAWRIGAVVVAGHDDRADIVVAAEADADTWADVDWVRSHPRLVVVGSGFGGRVTVDLPGLSLGEEALAFADDYDDPDVTAAAVAVDLDSRMTHGEVIDVAAANAVAGVRLLSAARLDTVQAVIDTLALPLVAGGSVVWCPRSAGSELSSRATTEQATSEVRGGVLRPFS